MALINFLNPAQYHLYFNDFDNFDATQWVITTVETGAGSATEALADGDGGVLLITNDAADNDADFFQLVKESFRYSSTKKLWFQARFKVSIASAMDWAMGLQIRNTNPLDTTTNATDGIYFQKSDGAANIDFKVVKNSTVTATSAFDTIVADTYKTLTFFYPGDGTTLRVYSDNVLKTTSVLTNVPDDEDLTITFGIQNGSAAARTMSVDYILVARER